MVVQFKCSECNAPAEWMYIDEIIPKIAPLCDEHMNEILKLHGEVDTEFYRLDDVEGWLEAINHLLKVEEKRYLKLLEEYSKLKGRPE
jgi:hypothetical protein